MSKARKRGNTLYKRVKEARERKGFNKPILVHVDEKTHAKLKTIADSEDRSLQVTVRRILENYAHQEK